MSNQFKDLDAMEDSPSVTGSRQPSRTGAGPAADASTQQARILQTSRGRILVFDPDRTVRDNIAAVLRSELYIAIVVETANGVLQALNSQEFDALFIKDLGQADIRPLIERVKKSHPNLEIRVFQGYGDFIFRQYVDYASFSAGLFELMAIVADLLGNKGGGSRALRNARYTQQVARAMKLKPLEVDAAGFAAFLADAARQAIARKNETGMGGENPSAIKQLLAGLTASARLVYDIQPLIDAVDTPLSTWAPPAARIIPPILAYSSALEQSNDTAMACNELRARSGTDFNSTVVEALISIVQAEAPAQNREGWGKTILLADVDKGLLVHWELRLGNEGLQVIACSDGKQALDIVQSRQVDAVLTEVNLPTLDGFALCEAIKNDPKTANIPVFFASSRSDSAAMNRGLLLGAEDYFTKPLNLDVLVTKLSRTLKVVQQGGAVAQRLASTAGAAASQSMPAAGPVINSIAEIKPGMLLGGRYEIEALIGQGGLGSVFKARDKKLDEDVALKVLKEEALDLDPAATERFIQEIKLTRRITHPNVIRLHDSGEFGPLHFICMEFFDGKTLKSLVRHHGGLPRKPVLTIIRQVAMGLGAAHSVGVIHRDIKPQNILINAQGQVKLLDFGIARIAGGSQLTKAGNFVGTPDYMSPEQCRSLETDARSDIYSLGVMMYELLAGRVPFKSEDKVVGVLMMHIKDPVPPISTFKQGVDADLEAIVMKCMEKNPLLRYQNIDELLAVLPLS
ncbi:MAG: Serine/threonine-protein kinase PknD [Myxococcota bacterium]|nr:Serine/threonine-protein kinase PknD [Myxococcota bacterium]